MTVKKTAASKSAPRTAPRRAAAKNLPTAVRAKKAAAALAEFAEPAPATGPRHAVFIDVENTSSEQALFDVLDALPVDRATRRTEVVAVGNWRVISQSLARRLGALGAQLVHSAPARGVRDWSDLWIAVAAGCWLGQARPGDLLDIVSNDRAFDAVGDAAAARGVVFHRLQHRRDVPSSTRAAERPEPARGAGAGRRLRRRAKTQPATSQATLPAGGRSAAPPHPPATDAHGASREQMLAVISRLSAGQTGRWINLDVLERALKAEGFSRPPGSPRLVTRLRALKKDVEVDSHGRVRLLADSGPA